MEMKRWYVRLTVELELEALGSEGAKNAALGAISLKGPILQSRGAVLRDTRVEFVDEIRKKEESR